MSDDHTEALNAAARVLNIEAEALSELSESPQGLRGAL